MVKITISAVEKRLYANTAARWAWHITKEITGDDGTTTRHLHVIDPIIIAARAAEYDIDPADIDTILDVLLCEPHMTEEEYGPHRSDFLHNPGDVATARNAHLKKAAKVKTRLGLVTQHANGDPHPLDTIRQAHAANHEFHRLFREQVQETRTATRATLNEPGEYDAVAEMTRRLQTREQGKQRRADAQQLRSERAIGGIQE